MAGEVWFGTRGYMKNVPAPAINVDAGRMGWSTQTNFMNGGTSVRRSKTAHREYNFSWNLTTRERIRAITDFADGIFGDGYLYYADPFNFDANMLPPYWAAPFMGIYDGPILNTYAITRPVYTPTPANTYGYPIESAIYTVAAGTKPAIWVPIPPGYTAWVGVHGTAGSGGGVNVTPTTGVAGLGTTTLATLLPVTTDTRFNLSYDSTAYNGVQLQLGGTGTVTLSGLMVQLLPTGATPPSGGFISGQGTSGLEFADQPSVTQYNAALDRVGLSATLVETETWS